MAVQNIKIERMKETTQVINGETKRKWLINNPKTSVFVGKWNADWKVGMDVKADVVQNGEFINLKCPPDMKPAFAGGGADNNLLKSIDANVKKILDVLGAAAVETGEDEWKSEPPVDEWKSEQPEQPEGKVINVDGIPF